MLVRAALIVAIAVMLAGAGLTLAAGGDSIDVKSPGAPTAAQLPTPGSYCETARHALQYEGHDPARRNELVNRVIDKAPPELVATIVTIRDSKLGSDEYVKAHNVWNYYNNNHCCQCIDAQLAPQIYELTPEQRAAIEAGETIQPKGR